MSLDWKNVRNLHPPLQTTVQDVIFSGHGSYQFQGETLVPDNIEFWTLAPPGATIADETGQALESMQEIKKLGIKNADSQNLINNTITRYPAGSMAPDYILHPPVDIIIKPEGPHIIGVYNPTRLSDLWMRVQPFTTYGQTIRCFWSACTAIKGAKNPIVLYQ